MHDATKDQLEETEPNRFDNQNKQGPTSAAMAQACKVRQFRYLVGLDKEPESVKMKIVFLLAVLFTTASGQRDVNHRLVE